MKYTFSFINFCNLFKLNLNHHNSSIVRICFFHNSSSRITIEKLSIFEFAENSLYSSLNFSNFFNFFFLKIFRSSSLKMILIFQLLYFFVFVEIS